ncbi:MULTISPECIES: hypothetical protein [unclassified Microbacterium]|uniref:hypothetical protein n=1 Tax=unclassified Microbacterium TaxID=2609290 RepID=UPI001370369A|nr:MULTISPECIES: hypothetical protein [unclassified Microbacterium]
MPSVVDVPDSEAAKEVDESADPPAAPWGTSGALITKDAALSTYGKWIRARMHSEGLRVSCRGYSVIER